MKKEHLKTLTLLGITSVLILMSCNKNSSETKSDNTISIIEIFPTIITETTPNDTDDPAIWYNSTDPTESLILGTDKGDKNGGIFVFDLDGKLNKQLSIYNLSRPNNIDIEYGFNHLGKKIDIALFTERGRDMIRVISLPECQFIDNGGISVFENETIKSPMGIALYKDKSENIFAFVGRKDGPKEGYLHQYQLKSTLNGVIAEKVRALGKFSGKKEIEALVVDDENGFLYYSDETIGVRKYYADAAKGNQEIALFAQNGIIQDHEGLSIYKNKKGNNYLILSDQQANKFHLYNLDGTEKNPHEHLLVRSVKTQTKESDGSDLLNMPLNNKFPNGLFVAMSNNKTFHYYNLKDVLGDLK